MNQDTAKANRLLLSCNLWYCPLLEVFGNGQDEKKLQKKVFWDFFCWKWWILIFFTWSCWHFQKGFTSFRRLQPQNNLNFHSDGQKTCQGCFPAPYLVTMTTGCITPINKEEKMNEWMPAAWSPMLRVQAKQQNIEAERDRFMVYMDVSTRSCLDGGAMTTRFRDTAGGQIQKTLTLCVCVCVCVGVRVCVYKRGHHTHPHHHHLAGHSPSSEWDDSPSWLLLQAEMEGLLLKRERCLFRRKRREVRESKRMWRAPGTPTSSYL